MKEKTLSVTAIREGTVIDHIRAGQALRILRLLRLLDESHQVTVGLNLKSPSQTLKDLIKIESVFLTEEQTAQIALFSPGATVNVIRDYKVAQKYQVRLPTRIEAILACPNRLCVTNAEKIPSHFAILEVSEKVHMRCLFCEKVHHHAEMLS